MLHAVQRITSCLIRCCNCWPQTVHRPSSQRRALLTLAIETSCDDTAVAILETHDQPSDKLEGEGTLDAHTRSSTATLHFNEKITAPNTNHGGIHPIEALKHHQASLATLVQTAIAHLPPFDADKLAPSPSSCEDDVAPMYSPRLITTNHATRRLPDFITVTRGPGMRSNLLCGLNTAKGLAIAWQLPLLGVHHMQAHTLTPRLVSALNSAVTRNKPPFPFLTLLVSGGHTMLLHSRGLLDHSTLATTRDIAIGDCLDKCGRLLLPDHIKSTIPDASYARHLSDYAFPTPESYERWLVPQSRHQEIDKPDNEYGWQVQTPMAKTREGAFSFSSVTSLIEKLYTGRQAITGGISEDERVMFARTALGVAFEHLASRTVIALEALNSQRLTAFSEPLIENLVVSGGVAANLFLRHFLRQVLDSRGFKHIELVFPPPWLCTDNAAMIAWCGIEMWKAGWRSELDIDVIRTWGMDVEGRDGGIMGAGGWMRSSETE